MCDRVGRSRELETEGVVGVFRITFLLSKPMSYDA